MAKLTKLKSDIIRGDTPVLSFPFTVSGVAANLTGWTLTFTATASFAPSLTDTPVIQIAKAGDSTGIVNFQLLRGQVLNDTNALTPGSTYYWDVQFDNGLSGASKLVFTPIRGQFDVVTDYTVGTS